MLVGFSCDENFRCFRNMIPNPSVQMDQNICNNINCQCSLMPHFPQLPPMMLDMVNGGGGGGQWSSIQQLLSINQNLYNNFYLSMAAASTMPGTCGWIPPQQQQHCFLPSMTGNPWLTSSSTTPPCPISNLSCLAGGLDGQKMSNTIDTESSIGFDLLNSKLRDDSLGRLQKLVSILNDNDDTVDVDVLMPNGTIIKVSVAQNATFHEIKEEVFELSQRGPMFGALRDAKLYWFSYVDEYGSQRDINDEDIRLCDACPMGNMLKLLEHQESGDDIELDEQIGQLIGKPLKDFDALMNPEVNEFRFRMRSLCEEIVKTRQANSWLGKMRYAFPTSVDTKMIELPDYLRNRLPSDRVILVQITFERPNFSVEINVDCQITAEDLIRKCIEQLLQDPTTRQALANELADDDQEEESYYETSFINNNPSSPQKDSALQKFLDPNKFLLKIHGAFEYLLDNHQLIQYKIIQELILSNQRVQLVAIHRHSIEFEDEPIYTVPVTDFRPRSHSCVSLGSLGGVHPSTRRRPQQIISSWSLDRKLLIKIHGAHINQLQFNSDITRVAVMVGIFHGGEKLCESHMTTPITLADLMKLSPQNPNLEIIDTITWKQDIVFDLKVSDLPRMARISFAMIGFTGSQSSKKVSQTRQQKPIAWANINFFDYRGQLWETSTTLAMWLHNPENDCDSDDLMSMFNPLGTVVPNPNLDQTIFLTISFTKYSENDNTVIRFPELKTILSEYPVSNHFGRERGNSPIPPSMVDIEESEYEVTYSPNVTPSPQPESQTNISLFPPPEKDLEDKEQNLALIKKISEEDLLHPIEEKHRDLLWRLRYECCQQVPESLCKLLISVKWNNQKMIGETLSLLHSWPKLAPSKALELLDYAYADSMVRKYSIECLKELSNEDLSQYLLQLVQALKYESYIYNDLVLFLLERAFESQRIGHHLFWLLRSEMHNPAVSVTFGLILEAYCRGAIDHIHILSRQMECLNKLKRINVIIRDDRSKENREKKIGWMQEILAQRFYQETFSNVINPLNPVYKLGRLKVEKCRFMDSKMKPLWLVFENFDQGASDIYLIFKNGDDLRQDMLTLQMIRIMDRLWKEAGYDFRMTPYRCISVEHCVGLIEVVLNADTIANIQKEKGAAAIAAFKKGSLLAWLRDHNPNESDLNRAIEEFTLSCAGYCVATYILGVADRHNDNIMVKKNGQMFHIDFGHILGKFKEKFGIRRERVPFVLTNDFVYVITHGGNCSKKSEFFLRFQEYCEEAFLIIRRRGSFFISLFAMMLSTGIPEISSVTDLQYLRETLVLDKSEEEARAHFHAKFMEALKNSWKTSFNWCAHSLSKDNRMNDR